MELWRNFYPLLSKSSQLIQFDPSGQIVASLGELFPHLPDKVLGGAGIPARVLQHIDKDSSPGFHCPLLTCELWGKKACFDLSLWENEGHYILFLREVQPAAQIKPSNWEEILRQHPSLPVLQDWDQSQTVLLAEDNPFNQKIIARMIEKAGFQCLTASNGKEALELLLRQACFLVLMDLNMPEMDGYQTLDAIREQMPAPINALPVIALTASPIDVEGAGFDSLLKKPVNLDELSALLKRYHLGAHEEQAIDLSYLREVSGGNPQTLRALIAIYLEEVPQAIHDMQQLAEDKEWRSLKELAHKTKANFKYVGAERLFTLAHRIEASTSAGTQVEQIPDLIQQLAVLNPGVVSELESFLENGMF